MKTYRSIIYLLLSLFMLFISTSSVDAAAVRAGICAGRQIVTTDGYCALESSIAVSTGSFAHTGLTLTGTEPGSGTNNASNIKYSATILEESQDLFCLDPNLQHPNQVTHAREITDSSFDLSLAKVYAQFVNDAVAANPGNPNFGRYLQTANVAMRALVRDRGYDNNLASPANWMLERNKIWDNIVDQFNGNTPRHSGSVKLEETGDYELARRYYRRAKGIEAGGAQPIFLNITVQPDLANRERNIEGGVFTDTIPIVIKGLAPLNTVLHSGLPENLKARFEIGDINCDGPVTCELDMAQSGVGADKRLPITGADEHTIYIKVTGNVADFRPGSPINGTVKFEYFHILDASNMIIMRDGAYTDKQRMLAIMPDTGTPGEFDIPGFPAPNPCEIIDGEYYVDGEVKTFEEFILADCCDEIEDPSTLTAEEADIYARECDDCDEEEEECDLEDDVRLVKECPDEEEYSTSWSRQRALFAGGEMGALRTELRTSGSSTPSIKDMITNRRETLTLGNENAVSRYINWLDTTFRNNRDDVYLFRGNENATWTNTFERDNSYCRMFTSEDSYINYPGAVASSKGGQYWFFNNPTERQPKVESGIDGLFYVDYERWLFDYAKAIKDERDAYDAWQEAAALENAIGKLEDCTEIDCEDCSSDPCSIYTGYEGTNTQTVDQNTFYKANGSAINDTTATMSCSCDGATPTPMPSPSASALEGLYNEAVAYRERLEGFIEQCKERVDIREQWQWFHEPDLVFHYEQLFYNTNPANGAPRNQVQVDEFKMIRVTNQDEEGNDVCGDDVTGTDRPAHCPDFFWPNVGEGQQKTHEECTAATKPINSKLNGTGAEQLIYGGGDSRVDDPYDLPDLQGSCEVSYEETIYYKTPQSTYSLMPTGLYLTDEEFSSYTGVLPGIEIGYVVNTHLTTYRGVYNFWFTMNNIGHYMCSGEKSEEPYLDDRQFGDEICRSNVQAAVDRYIDENPERTSFVPRILESTQFVDVDDAGQPTEDFINDLRELYGYECTFEHDGFKEIPEGNPCDPEDPSTWDEPFFYRAVTINDLSPTGRNLSRNWADEKGAAAREIIENEQDGDAIIGNPDEFLEYHVVVGPNEMAEWRERNRVQQVSGMGFNDFDMTCNDFGFECESNFLSSLGDDVLRNRQGLDRWRWYRNGSWGAPESRGMGSWYGEVRQALIEILSNDPDAVVYWP